MTGMLGLTKNQTHSRESVVRHVINTVADLEGVRVVRLNPPLGPNYFSFMGKFMKDQVKC